MFVFNANGQAPALQWQRAVGGSGGDIFTNMIKSADGNFIAVGTSTSNDGDVRGFRGATDAFIAKFDRSGKIIWSKLFGGTSYDELYSIIQTPDGGYISIGSTYSDNGDVRGNHGLSDIWVIKIAANGTLLWQKCFGGSQGDSGLSITPAHDGNYLIAGVTLSNDGEAGGNHGNSDGWLLKIDAQGNLLQQKCFGGTNIDAFTNVIPTSNNGFMIIGYTLSNDGDVSGLHNTPGSSNSDQWVVKVDDNFNIQWQKCYGEAGYTSSIYQVIEAPGGGYLLVGDVEKGQPSTRSGGDLANYYGNLDGWVIKIDNTGAIQWQRNLGTAQYDLLGNGILTSDGDFLLIGESSSNGSTGDGWLVNLNSKGDVQWQLYIGGAGNQQVTAIAQVNSCEYIFAGGIDHQIPGYHGGSDGWVADIATVLIPSVSITSEPGNNICAGTPAKFTATPVNGETSPVYQWQKNGINVGGNGSTYTDNALADKDVVTVSLNSNARCATSATANSNSITIKVGLSLTPAVSIASDLQNNICRGTPVTFTATPVNGGTSPVYQWQKNGINVGGNLSTYTDNTLADNDVVKVSLTGNAACATPTTANSNSITIKLNPNLAPAVSIASDLANNICRGTPVTFTATPVNGGTSPVYQWHKNGINVGGHGSTYIDNSLADNDVVTVSLTSNATCATPANANSNSITIKVNSLVAPAVNIVSDAGNDVCQGMAVTFTATPVNGGTSPAYQWKKNGVNTGGNGPVYSDNNLANKDVITVVLTSNASCVIPTTANSNSITMTVTEPLIPSVSIASGAGNNICGGTLVTFTAIPVNGGTSPVYQWKKNGVNVGSNSSTYLDNTLVSNDIITATLTSNASCVKLVTANSNSIAMAVTTPLKPSVSIASSPDGIIYKGTPVTFTAIPVNGGNSPIYQWKKNGINIGNNSPTYTDNTLDNGDVITVVMTSSYFCLAEPTSTADKLINVLPAELRVIKIPNTFTPNGDGINDAWNINSLENYPNCTVTIYSRWGAMIFSSIGYRSPWDGTIGVAKAPAGVYYYIVDIKDGTKPYAGWVTLIR